MCVCAACYVYSVKYAVHQVFILGPGAYFARPGATACHTPKSVAKHRCGIVRLDRAREILIKIIHKAVLGGARGILFTCPPKTDGQLSRLASLAMRPASRVSTAMLSSGTRSMVSVASAPGSRLAANIGRIRQQARQPCRKFAPESALPFASSKRRLGRCAQRAPLP